LLDLLGNIKGKEILGCGCGMGNLSVYLAMMGAHVKGFGISSEMLKVAHANAKKNGISGKCNFLCCSFEDLSYRDTPFDPAVGVYILHHVGVERAVRESHRVLKPGGRAVFIETWGKSPPLGVGGRIFGGEVWHS